ncbi:hypothetical protein F5Y18DRAFT_232590 [Xylariaceae sp. FL1019]|nr:hypothetical protein F5Y18DRAFT_232590 [Xylariaceae sp. FL1019]
MSGVVLLQCWACPALGQQHATHPMICQSAQLGIRGRIVVIASLLYSTLAPDGRCVQLLYLHHDATSDVCFNEAAKSSITRWVRHRPEDEDAIINTGPHPRYKAGVIAVERQLKRKGERNVELSTYVLSMRHLSK